ncbi:type VI secretion system tube protein TssD, partial [Bacteroides sp. YC-2022]
FNQGTNTDGKPQTDVRGGTLYLTYAGLPQDDMLHWILNSKKYEDGAIVICDDSDEPLEKILFEQAACTGLNIEYTQKGKAYIHTKIILQVRKIKVGETTFENRWTINE